MGQLDTLVSCDSRTTSETRCSLPMADAAGRAASRRASPATPSGDFEARRTHARIAYADFLLDLFDELNEFGRGIHAPRVVST